MKGEGAPGWHGKLPSVSDFASRRMDARLVDLWDPWISAGLARMRSDDPAHWVEAYLASPTWRFICGPGFFPSPFHLVAWTGVLMPSVDRVGRYYPLTLTASLEEIPREFEARDRLWRWLVVLEDTAVQALECDWSIESLESALFQLGLPASQSRGSACLRASEPPVSTIAEFFDSAAMGSCAWFSEAHDAHRLLHSRRRDEEICRLWTS